nr:DMT family transporter [Aromatoleum diolicum]
MMCVTCLCFAALDTLIKYLSKGFPLTEVIWVRYAVQTLAIAILFAPRMKSRILRTANLRLQLLRGGCLLGASLLVINGLSRLPLTETTAVLFLAPLIITMLSGPVLGERVKAIDWFAVVLGFIGVLIIVRPGGGLLTWAILFPIGTACCNAVYQMVTRFFHSSEHPVTTNLYTGLVGVVVLAPVMPFVWKTPDLEHAAIMVLAGLVGGLAHYIITKALECSSAMALGPYSYTQLVWAAMLGFMVFGALPDPITWVGIAVIASSGLLLSFYHLLAARRR